MDKVESVTDNDQRQLVCQFCLLQEVFHPLWIIAVTLPTNSLHFLDLSSFTRSLDVLEMHIRILTKVNNGSQKVEQT